MKKWPFKKKVSIVLIGPSVNLCCNLVEDTNLRK